MGDTYLPERAAGAVRASELAQRHLGEQIVLVAHGGVMDALYRLATHQDIEAPRTWDLGNAAINRLLHSDEGMVLIGWADIGHLERIGGGRA